MQTLVIVQYLPIDTEKAWIFFSDPRNLAKLTPPAMHFRITGGLSSEKIYPGMIITYKVSPIFGIPLTWVTEISQVKDREFFVDEQRSGPYRFWHHQHLFRQVENGTEMTDIVNFAAPLGALGRLAEKSFIRKKIEMIFEYRSLAMKDIFGDHPS